jgi:hypothetical protein
MHMSAASGRAIVGLVSLSSSLLSLFNLSLFVFYFPT